MDLELIQKQRDEQQRLAEREQELAEVNAVGAKIDKALNFQTNKLIANAKTRINKVQSVDPLASPDDIQAVVDALNSLGDKLAPKELQPVIDALSSVVGEIGKLPKELPKFPEFPKFPELPKSTKVDNLNEIKPWLEAVVTAVGKLELNPKIEVTAPSVTVSEKEVDLSPITKGLDEVKKALGSIKLPETDLSSLETSVKATTKAINSLQFPVPNYVLPFRDTEGRAVQVQLDSSGNVPISGGAAGGDLHTATKGATAAGYPTSTAASADRQPLDVTLRDTSGAPVSVGGGTQYADGAARGTATGTIAMVDDGTNIQSLSGDSTGKLNVNNISGTVSLPTGAATSAAQTDKSQFTKLTDGTDTALITAAGEQNVLATAQPGVDIGDVTINNAAGASAVNIQDGGNSITVDGTVGVSGSVAVTGPLTDTQLRASAVPVSLATNTPTLQAGSTTTVTQATGTNLHTVVDSGVITSITNAIPVTTTTTSTHSNVANSVTSVTLLALNTSRKSATIYNDDTAASLYVKFGTTASSTSFKIKIAPGGYYEFPLPIYTGRVDGIATAATGSARICEET